VGSKISDIFSSSDYSFNLGFARLPATGIGAKDTAAYGICQAVQPASAKMGVQAAFTALADLGAIAQCAQQIALVQHLQRRIQEVAGTDWQATAGDTEERQVISQVIIPFMAIPI
jgi:hypothetical protein